MNLVNQQVGDAVAEWDETEPLRWIMRKTVGRGDDRRTVTYEFDLTKLRVGYEMGFLLAIKDAFISHARRLALISIETEVSSIRTLLANLHGKQPGDGKIDRVDAGFLLSLRTISEDIPLSHLHALKRLYKHHRSNSLLFAPSLHIDDFPEHRSKRGAQGDRIDRILAQALTRAAQVAVLQALEDAYEAGTIDIAHYSFGNLAFHAYCRPDSYRTLRVCDLTVDIAPDSGQTTYILYVLPVKAGIDQPRRIPYPLSAFVGELLVQQRQAVVAKYSHLIASENLGQLALFPSRRLLPDGNWRESARHTFGVMTNRSGIDVGYLRPIKKLLTGVKLTFNALRHTVGTQLAVAGCSAPTIQAVLRHAGEQTCQAYVDVAFHGLIDRLSDGLQPAFEAHFPAFDLFRGKSDPVSPERRIDSENMETGQVELTGECGRTVACQYAPLSCYACPRFIPCFDADHSINLDQMKSEARKYEAMGQPFKQLAEKSKHICRHIQVVMIVCEQKRLALLTEIEA